MVSWHNRGLSETTKHGEMLWYCAERCPWQLLVHMASTESPMATQAHGGGGGGGEGRGGGGGGGGGGGRGEGGGGGMWAQWDGAGEAS